MEKRQLRQLPLALVVLVILMGGWSGAETFPKDCIALDALAAFGAIDSDCLAAIAELDTSRLAWGESYALMGYVAMYEGTGDVTYLTKVQPRFEKVLQSRSDKQDLPDAIRQKKMAAAWSTSRYTEGTQYAWLVDSGMISYPIARWAYVVKRDPQLQKEYGVTAERYIKAMRETVASFDDDWRESGDRREGYYYDPYLKRDVPFNQQNALGRTLVALWLATGDSEYRSKSEKLARYFKNRLIPQGDRYTWPYWPGGEGSEDIGHAAINVDFAFMCYKAGIIFTEIDMKRFCETLKFCGRGEKGFSQKVDGTGDESLSRLMGLWGHLGLVNQEVRTVLHRYFKQHWPSGERTWMATAAYLVETQRPLELDRVVR